MKIVEKIMFYILAFMVLTCEVYGENSIPSTIKEVVLFSDKALVKREAITKVSKGVSEITIESEAFDIDKESVQVKVFGLGEIYSIQVKDLYMEEASNENIKELEKKIEELGEMRTSIYNELDVLSKQEIFLSSILDFSKSEIPKDIKTNYPTIENLGKTLSFISSSYADVNKSKENGNLKIRNIDKEMSVLEKRLSDINDSRQLTKKAITVLFNSFKEQEVRAEASYLVSQAYWTPFYNVDVSTDLKDITLKMFANISQKTGEDWRNVRLSISNVVPLKGAEMPNLSTWYLNIHTEEPLALRRGFAYTKASSACFDQSLASEVSTSSQEAVAPLPEADFSKAKKLELPISFEYVFPEALNVNMEDKETTLPLFSKNIKGDYLYFSVPSKNELTFLICRAISDKEILSGPMNVSYGGRFIDSTVLNTKKPGEFFDINLGADRNVSVKREIIKDKMDENRERSTHSYPLG